MSDTSSGGLPMPAPLGPATASPDAPADAGDAPAVWTTGAFWRLFGLILAFAALCLVGVLSAHGRFASVDNALVILRQGAIIGVISVGMTFVVTAAGIDLSVGANAALASVMASGAGIQQWANDHHWIAMVGAALLFGALVGLVNGVLIAYGKVVPFIATLAMFASARGLAEIRSDRKTQIVDVPAFEEFFNREPIPIPFTGKSLPMIVVVFAVVAVLGWIVLNRTTFGRRTFAVGGNPEAARLAGINVNRHTAMLYVLLGLCCGVAAVLLLSRTTTGSATHGQLYELDTIAAVVIGGTLLSGGRGSITGTIFGVAIFSTLTNIFTLNNLSISAQNVAKGAVIVAAVLLQQLVASRSDR
jgi:ribose transport system permease protein